MHVCVGRIMLTCAVCSTKAAAGCFHPLACTTACTRVHALVHLVMPGAARRPVCAAWSPRARTCQPLTQPPQVTQPQLRSSVAVCCQARSCLAPLDLGRQCRRLCLQQPPCVLHSRTHIHTPGGRRKLIFIAGPITATAETWTAAAHSMCLCTHASCHTGVTHLLCLCDRLPHPPG